MTSMTSMNSITTNRLFDERLAIEPATRQVYSGSSNISLTSQASSTNSPANVGFTIQVSNYRDSVQCDLPFTATVFFQVNVTYSGDASALTAGLPILGLGSQALGGTGQPQAGAVSLASFPLSRCWSTITLTINQTNQVLQANQIAQILLRMTDFDQSRKTRLCSYMNDLYMNMSDGAGAVNNPMASFNNATTDATLPNNSLPSLNFVSGVAPCSPLTPACGNLTVTNQSNYTINMSFNSTESVMVSPFDYRANGEAIPAINQLNRLVFNFQVQPAAQARFLRAIMANNWTITSYAYYTPSSLQSQFLAPTLQLKTISPSLTLPVADVCYKRIPNYNLMNPVSSQPLPTATVVNGVLTPTTVSISNTTANSFSTMPEMFVIWVTCDQNQQAGNAFNNPIFADMTFPIQTIAVKIGNDSQLLATENNTSLYTISTFNGVEQSWCQNQGLAYGANGKMVPLTGSYLCIRPARDIPLPLGVSIGSNSNFTFQLNSMTFLNPLVFASTALTYTVNVLAIADGYLILERGLGVEYIGGTTSDEAVKAPILASDQEAFQVGGGRRGVHRRIGGALVHHVHHHHRHLLHHMHPMNAGRHTAGEGDGRKHAGDGYRHAGDGDGDGDGDGYRHAGDGRRHAGDGRKHKGFKVY